MFESEKIADFICSDIQIPQEVQTRAKELILDAVGCGIAGSQEESLKNALLAMQSLPNTQGDCWIWGREERMDCVSAAMLNGIASHALDFDDTHTEAILHASAILAPLCLSYGFEVCSNGEKVLEAFIKGWEVSSRIGIASCGSFHQRGFHTTAICGVFGATSAVCVLLGLKHSEVVNALGIAGSFASGINEFLSNGSDSKVIHIANAIKNGILSGVFAKNGMRGPKSVFEGRDNVFRAIGIQEKINLKRLSEGFGEIWQVMQVSLKPYPCCHFAHGLIECMKSLREDGVLASEIAEIKCFVDAIPIGFICDPIEKKYAPKSAYEAKFSMPFLMALMFVEGEVQLSSYENLENQEVIDFAKKITYEKRDSKGFPKYFPGHLQATLKDQRVIYKDVLINRGNFDNPLSLAEVQEKFRKNTSRYLSADKILEIMTWIETLQDQKSMKF